MFQIILEHNHCPVKLKIKEKCRMLHNIEDTQSFLEFYVDLNESIKVYMLLQSATPDTTATPKTLSSLMKKILEYHISKDNPLSWTLIFSLILQTYCSTTSS